MDSPASSPDAIDRDPSEGISSEPGEQNAAPKYAIPLRDLAAVEIPAIVESVDRAVKAFGRNTSLRHACIDRTLQNWPVADCCLDTRPYEKLHTAVSEPGKPILQAHHVA
jgi:hypothetical protein